MAEHNKRTEAKKIILIDIQNIWLKRNNVNMNLKLKQTWLRLKI